MTITRAPRPGQVLGEVFRLDGLCAETDPDAFFPEKGDSNRDAKRICARCEVIDACLKWALDKDERYGVWGGLSEMERRKLRKASAASS